VSFRFFFSLLQGLKINRDAGVVELVVVVVVGWLVVVGSVVVVAGHGLRNFDFAVARADPPEPITRGN